MKTDDSERQMSYPEIPDISRLSVDTRGAEIVDDATEVNGV